jgi:hypothetical protein
LPPGCPFSDRIHRVGKEDFSLVVADLNGDGKPDLAYYGDPKELVVQYNQGSNGWSAPKRWPIDDGQLTANALATGDLNGDKLTDLVLLGENNIYFLAQNPDHTLAEPQKIPFSGEVKAVQVLDIDGDGRDDLLLVNWDSPNPFRFRLQNTEGELGPEIYFTCPPSAPTWRTIWRATTKRRSSPSRKIPGARQVSQLCAKAGRAALGRFQAGASSRSCP